MVACVGYLATICWSTRQAWKGAAEPSDSGAEIRLARVATLISIMMGWYHLKIYELFGSRSKMAS